MLELGLTLMAQNAVVARRIPGWPGLVGGRAA